MNVSKLQRSKLKFQKIKQQQLIGVIYILGKTNNSVESLEEERRISWLGRWVSLSQIFLQHLFCGPGGQGMKMRTPLFKKPFHENTFLVIIHVAPFVLGLVFVQAHVLAELSEEELSALAHGLLRLRRMRVHSGGPRRQLRCEGRVADASIAGGGAGDSAAGESDGGGGGDWEERGNNVNSESHLDGLDWIDIFFVLEWSNWSSPKSEPSLSYNKILKGRFPFCRYTNRWTLSSTLCYNVYLYHYSIITHLLIFKII